ncbi:MAG: hypothetical protein L6Q84_12745 [Polyangiaceae bacterium]|nr:hypothetical protein [Polyangiaceae bacterium]
MALDYPTYADKAIFVDLLAEGADPTEPATPVELEAWIVDREIPFTTAVDLPGAGQRILKDFSPIESTFLVELGSMTIVEHARAPTTLYPALDAL